MHVLYIFDSVAPYILNDDVEKLWGHGFTKTKKLDGNTDIGLYVTAYLTDLDLDENEKLAADEKLVKEVNGKKYLKGGRLHMYPAGMHIYRCSRGIKKPEKFMTRNEYAMKMVEGSSLVYEKTYVLEDTKTGFQTTVNNKVYNKCVHN